MIATALATLAWEVARPRTWFAELKCTLCERRTFGFGKNLEEAKLMAGQHAQESGWAIISLRPGCPDCK